MHLTFSGEVWYWRGPSPFHFVSMPAEESNDLRELSSQFTYGWGMIPCTARIGATTWTTAMFLKDERYILPLKVVVRNAESIELGDIVTVDMTIGE